MNQDMNGNSVFFWKEASEANGGEVESGSRIKDRNGRLTIVEDEVRRIWKDHFEGLYKNKYPVAGCSPRVFMVLRQILPMS